MNAGVDPTHLAEMSAEQIISALDLQYLEGEGVWFQVVWRTAQANSIYGLLTPTDFSALHVLPELEAWVHVAGAPVDMTCLHADHSVTNHVLGQEVGAGQQPQYLVPANSWQGSTTRGRWSLVVCTLSPPFSAFELASPSTDFTPWLDKLGEGVNSAQLNNRLKELIRE